MAEQHRNALRPYKEARRKGGGASSKHSAESRRSGLRKSLDWAGFGLGDVWCTHLSKPSSTPLSLRSRREFGPSSSVIHANSPKLFIPLKSEMCAPPSASTSVSNTCALTAVAAGVCSFWTEFSMGKVVEVGELRRLHAPAEVFMETDCKSKQTARAPGTSQDSLLMGTPTAPLPGLMGGESRGERKRERDGERGREREIHV
ncbi:hypothetical protein WMY93_002145 [Mugilogobius chulae]|uniref:Uncharacterized protein n=1 Tax=Mugilogobius chulae TaxID=88201 RepID=A0AAW0Q3V6_9GOBI